jgi:hypothetical protein
MSLLSKRIEGILMNLQDFYDKVSGLVKQQTCKTEGGTCYPSSDYAVVPDAEKPSTWKLRLSQGKSGNITASQLGRAAAAFSSGGFRGNRVQLSSKEATQAKARIRREYIKLGIKREDMPDSVKETDLVHIWKEADGQYHCLLAYSNNYRDDDNPPEIISSQSHKEFGEALEKGEWPMPKLWLWHIPYPVGQVTSHTYDENTGFSLAGAVFDKGKEWVAEGILKSKWNGVSHGMPKEEVKRDDSDGTIITRHRTREISLLPEWAAANKLSFYLIGKEIDMNENKELPAHKRQEFVEAFGEDKVAQIEEELANRKQQADESKTESKEVSVSETVAATVELSASPDLIEAIKSLTQVVTAIKEKVIELDTEVKELSKTDSQKVAEKATSLPEASLTAFVKSSLFGESNKVTEKGDGPSENAQVADGSSGLFFEELGWMQPGGSQ